MQGFVKTPLWEKTPGWREDTHLQGEPYLVFVPGNSGSPTILIAHGGGFSWRTGCEGPNVAWYFHQAGYNTAILSYRLLPYDRYASMADMQRAIRLLRARKEEFGIGEKIVVMGFSAGGMICGNCATHFDNGSQTAPDLVQQMLCISIEDDGEGYPKEILKQFQAGEKPKPSEDGTHLGLWSLWEMLRIMYDRNDLMELKNAEPHGTRTIFYLPKEAINETGKKTSGGDVV